MATATCELRWLRQLLLQLKIGDIHETKLICDNQVALHIASNSVFHKEPIKVLFGEITSDFVNSSNQLADVLTNSLRGPRIEYICNKLGAYDIYAPA